MNYAPGFNFVIYTEPDYVNNISLNFSLKNKFINHNSTFRFILEFGSIIQFEISNKQYIRQMSEYKVNFGDFYIGLGPEILIGLNILKINFPLKMDFL